jgi:RND family efflux transporter MFP subunit
MKKPIWIAIGLAVVGALGWQIYQRVSVSDQGFSHRRNRVPVAVEVAPVQIGTIRKTGSFTGTLKPFSEFVMAPKIAGRLVKLMVDIGDHVESGQLVAVLDDDEYRQQVVQANAELEVARANLKERRNTLENAKREYERTVALRQKKIASESQLDAAESEYNIQKAKLDVALAQVAQNEAALKVAQVRLSYTQIQVPENSNNGYRVVGERFVDEGAMLSANKEIVSILDIGTLIAAIHVIERDYSEIKRGLAAVVSTDAYPGRTFPGNVVRIAPLLKENSREARVEVEIPNEQLLLKPGMFVRVAIEFDEHDNAVIIPHSALIKRNGVQGVFLADSDTKTATFSEVTVGIVSGDQVEVLAPPISGLVVTLGHHLLEDGGIILLPGDRPLKKPDAAPHQKNAAAAGRRAEGQ